MLTKAKIVFLLLLSSLFFYSNCFAITVKLNWDHTVEVGETPPKFRIYSKLKSETAYTTPAIWDSKTDPNPTGVRQATIVIADGKEYNFIARSYLEGKDINQQPITVESDNSNEVIFNAPVFALTGLVLSSFTNSETYIGTVYYGATGTDIRMSWSSLTGATAYEFKLYEIQKKYN